jgi:hypothetical protein
MTQVLAHPVDQTVAPIVDTELHQLVTGLSAVNPQLQNYLREKGTTDAQNAVSAGEDAARRAALEALDPKEALNAPAAMPDSVAPAYARNFEAGFKNVLGTAIGNKAQDDILTAWSKVRHTADPEQFLQEQTASQLGGFTDPAVLAKVSAIHEATAKAIRNDGRAVAAKKLDDSTRENINASLSVITPAMSVNEQFASFVSWRSEAAKTGLFNNTELVAQFADRLHANSASMGGDPSAFDAFFGGPVVDGKPTLVDPATGKTLADLNPDLAVRVDGFRKAAQAQLDTRMFGEFGKAKYQIQTDLEAQVISSGVMPTDEVIKSHIGKLGIFEQYGEALAWKHKMQTALDKQEGLKVNLELVGKGMGYAIAKPEDQIKAMDAVTAPAVAAFVAGSMDSTPAGQAAANIAIGRILKAQADSGVNVPITTLKHGFASFLNKVPTPGEDASPMFKAYANLYRQLPPNLRSMYASEDVQSVLESYNAQTTNGSGTQSDSATAYQQAYAGISPEAKKLADNMRKDPEFNARVESKVKNLTTSWVRDMLPSWTGLYPTNEHQTAQFAKDEAIRYAVQNPMRSESEIMSHVQKWYSERFVHDTTSNKVVEVPGGQANDRVAEAIADYTADARKRIDPDSKAELRLVGTTYQLVDGYRLVDSGIKLSDITQHAYLKKNWDVSQQEGARMQALQQSINDGTATSATLAEGAPLIAKARTMGVWTQEMEQKLTTLRRDSFKKDTDSIMNMVPPTTNLDLGHAQAKSDGRSMTTLARQYWDRGAVGEALTVMNEGVILTKKPDNKGHTIGVGYNLEQNDKTLAEDFRRSGIPAESVEAIKAGKASITEDQAMRLFAISYGRAKAVAQSGLDSIYGKGSWAKLPQNKQAVMTDVAYQVGNITTFKQSMESFMKGDTEAMKNAFKVRYQSPKDGSMVEDVPRNNLRSHLLNGTGTFSSIIDEVAAKPTSLIEAKAMAQR